MLFIEEAFITSKLSSQLAAPAIADIQEANAAVCRLKGLFVGDARLVFKAGLQKDDLRIACVTDAPYDNLPGHNSQRGHVSLGGQGSLLRNHSRWHLVQAVPWQSSRIQ